MQTHARLRTGLLATAVLMSAAGPALAASPYSLLTTITIPASRANTNPGGALSSFDISSYDTTNGFYYLGDRSNASIDVINGKTNTFVGSIPGFVGFRGSNDTSGADGTLEITTPLNQHILLGGDGDSTVKAFTIPSGTPTNVAGYTPLYTANTVLPNSTPTLSARADELSYDSKDNLVLVANNAGNPSPYSTIFNASTGAIVAQTVFDGTNGNPIAGNGLEQSVWDPKSGNFFVAMPQFGNSATDPGGLVEIDPTGKLVASFNFGAQGITSCTPSGLVISTGGALAVGCANGGTQTVIFDPATGKIVATPKISGSDELYYDPATNLFLATNTAGGKFGIIDASSFALTQVLSTTTGSDHSIASGGGEIFVPFSANAANTICPLGCVGVYAMTPVPEPSTLPIMLTAMLGLIGFGVRRRKR